MKILLTHRFFWPDTAPYATLLRAIGARLVVEGHAVSVLSSIPSYRAGSVGGSVRDDVVDGMAIRRVWVMPNEKEHPLRRVMNVVLYTWALFWTVLRTRPDVVTAAAFPPVFAAWSASLAARLVGASFVYHVQDIHPEVSEISGDLMARWPVAPVMRWLDNQSLRRSAAIIVLSKDMADTLAARGLGTLPVHVINNFELDSFGTAEPPPPALRKRAGKRRVIFAGNLGRFQSLPLLAEGVAHLFDSRPELELFFLGDGAALAELRARWAGHPQVGFGPFLPFSQARELIQEADIGLVALMPGVYRVAYPSKVATYLSLGLPVLALVEPGSNLAWELTSKGYGRVPSEPTPQAIATCLSELLDAPHAVDAASIPDRAATEDALVALFARLAK